MVTLVFSVIIACYYYKSIIYSGTWLKLTGDGTGRIQLVPLGKLDILD